jgi:hypothetical protein
VVATRKYGDQFTVSQVQQGWAQDQSAPSQKGIMGMTEKIYSYNSTSQGIGSPAKWDQPIKINSDGGTSIIGGPTDLAMITTVIHVGGLKPGQTFYACFIICDTKSDASDPKYDETSPNRRRERAVSGDSSGSYRTLELTFAGSIPKPSSGRSKRLRLVYKCTQPQGVSIGAVMVEGIST